MNPEASEAQLVKIGRMAILVAMLLAALICPYMGIDKKGGFQYIQEYTGFVSPGVFAMFILGFFWKKTSSNAALFATIGGFLFSLLLKFLPQLIDLSFLASAGYAVPNGQGLYEIPFMDRMAIAFLVCIIGMIFISIRDAKRKLVTNGLEIGRSMFKVETPFAVGSLLILGFVAAMYVIFWG